MYWVGIYVVCEYYTLTQTNTRFLFSWHIFPELLQVRQVPKVSFWELMWHYVDITKTNNSGGL